MQLAVRSMPATDIMADVAKLDTMWLNPMAVLILIVMTIKV